MFQQWQKWVTIKGTTSKVLCSKLHKEELKLYNSQSRNWNFLTQCTVNSKSAYISPLLGNDKTVCRQLLVTSILISMFLWIQGFISASCAASIAYSQQILKPYNQHQTFSELVKKWGGDTKPSIRNFWCQFHIKMAILLHLTFYVFFLYTWQFTGMQHQCIMSHLHELDRLLHRQCITQHDTHTNFLE